MPDSKTVDDYISAHSEWTDALQLLRSVLLAGGLRETLKWGAPCYTRQGKNLVGLLAFKSWTGLWFHQGALLKDPLGQLINAGQGRTKALRQWRFSNVDEINPAEVAAYVAEAIQLADRGAKVPPARGKPLEIPPELQKALAADSQAAQQFETLGRSRQRDYAEYISGAKREATKLTRLEKILPMIRAGTGLNDRYRK